MTCLKTLNFIYCSHYMVILRYNHTFIYPVTKIITCGFCHLPCRFSGSYKNYFSSKFFHCSYLRLFRMIF